jgi:hypothetical protein
VHNRISESWGSDKKSKKIAKIVKVWFIGISPRDDPPPFGIGFAFPCLFECESFSLPFRFALASMPIAFIYASGVFNSIGSNSHTLLNVGCG